MHVENPNDDESDIFYKQASQLYKEKKYDESLRIYDKSLEINPNNAQSLNGKGLCLIKKDENEKAVQIFNQAISLSNNECNSDFIYNKS
jgi:tetratricopeptide (TPR) repeat protein